jgi:hypothetical protein
MIEVAVAAMQEAIAANGETAPAGSLDPERRPIDSVLGPVPTAGEAAEPPHAGADAVLSDRLATVPSTGTDRSES